MTHKNDYSFGIIPLQKKGDSWQVFIIKHHGGHWGFPKGHAENEENPQDAAARELKEETGLTVVEYLDTPSMTENYSFSHSGQRIHKKVIYFAALVSGHINLQTEEIEQGIWTDIKQCEKTLSFEEAKSMVKQVIKHLFH